MDGLVPFAVMVGTIFSDSKNKGLCWIGLGPDLGLIFDGVKNFFDREFQRSEAFHLSVASEWT